MRAAFLDSWKVWLVNASRACGFRIYEGGERLEIRGSALRPELVPLLVQRLSSEPTFAGRSFQTLSIDRAHDAQRVDFLLHTMGAEAEASG